MDVSAASTSMASAQILQSASVSMLKNVMEAEEAVAASLMQCLGDLSVGTSSSNIDIYI